MITFFTASVLRLFLLCTALGVLAIPLQAQTDAAEAYLRFKESGGTRSYYVAVYVKTPPAGGLDQIRASLRDVGDNKKLLSTTIEPPPARDDSRFVIPLTVTEDDIYAQLSGYRVFIDSYPTATGVEDHEINVGRDVEIALSKKAARCRQMTAIMVGQISNTDYGARQFSNIMAFLRRDDAETFIATTVTKELQAPEPRDITFEPSTPQLQNPAVGIGLKGLPLASWCFVMESPPAGEYTVNQVFAVSTGPELHFRELKETLKGPDGPDATEEKRGLEDFLDLGLTLTSSVEEEEQADKTSKRVRTTRGVMDLFLAPILNLRTVKPLGRKGGVVQIFTPFYIDSKISTGKITKDTLALNRVELGSTYEFRQYRIKAYSDLFRHALSFKHNSDRDFKQDEFKFVYEFQPIWGRLNRPLGSALNILNGEPVPDTTDRFGYEVVPIVGVELGRTYRVRDPKEFEGISRNVRRFYFGASMTFDLTKYLQLSLEDLFYVRGENEKDRTENYFVSSIEAPLGQIGKLRAAHALFLSFERGEQAPFSNPSVNILKFGYRIRARGLLIR